MRVCLLASGSKGNALYIETGESRMLIDAGLSGREISDRLSTIGVGSESLHAILVTHEHVDHCRGVGPLARRLGVPVFMTPLTRQALPGLGRIEQLHEFHAGESFRFRDLRIHPFPVTHDASETVGFIIESREGKIGVATDLGLATRLVTEQLKGCRVLVVESNHDEIMLRDGPYPWHLKQRIRSHHGHLSNAAAADLLQQLLWDGLEAVFLAHLSECNNDPALAGAVARNVLDRQNCCCPALLLGAQHAVSPCFSG